jgi:hypothetical protein
LPYPVNRHTGEPQQPNGAVVTWTPDASRTTRAPEGHVSEPANGKADLRTREMTGQVDE